MTYRATCKSCGHALRVHESQLNRLYAELVGGNPCPACHLITDYHVQPEQEVSYYEATCLACTHTVSCDAEYLGQMIQEAQADTWRCSTCGEGAGFTFTARRREPEPVSFTEKAVKKEVDACMGELQLWLGSDEGKKAAERVKYDPKGPWGDETAA